MCICSRTSHTGVVIHYNSSLVSSTSNPSLILLVPSLLLSTVYYPVRDQKVLAEEVLSEVIELNVVGAKSVSSSNTAHASQLVHVLRHDVSISSQTFPSEGGEIEGVPQVSRNLRIWCGSSH